jgi:hypothetical protein
MNQFRTLNDQEKYQIKHRIISDVKKLIQDNSHPITLVDILESKNGNKFNFIPKITESQEKIYYGFPEILDNIYRHSIIFKDPIGGQKSFFANVPIEYINFELKKDLKFQDEHLKKEIEKFFEKESEEFLGLGRINLESYNNKILIFENEYEIAIHILLGEKILPLRIFLNEDSNSLISGKFQKWNKNNKGIFTTSINF